MKNIYALAMAAILSAVCISSASADDITADILTYDGKTKVASASGNVVIHANQGATITGQNGEYHFENRSAWLEGNIRYEKDQTTMTAGKMYLYEDSTIRGLGSVYINDAANQRIIKGDDVMYNPDTGFGQISGSGYLESPDGMIEAPLIEGNMKQVKIVASGGVQLSSQLHDMTGYSDTAVYTRTGQNGTDGKLTMTGHAHVVQNGNTFDGPELVMRDAERIVETTGRSTIVITNTDNGGRGKDENSGAQAPEEVTDETAIAGRPAYADKPVQSPIETKESK